jgi:hypothetical protein
MIKPSILFILLVVLVITIYPTSVAESKPPDAPLMQGATGIDCTTGAFATLAQGATATVECPACERRAFYGDEIYTDDSSICSAAAHSGVIELSRGGVVTIEVLPGQDHYPSTTKNGLTSNEFGNWGRSFRIVGATPAENPNDNESKEALCTMLQLNQTMLTDEASRINSLVERYNQIVKSYDADISSALDAYVACTANCDILLIRLGTLMGHRGYIQGHLNILSSLIENNRVAQENNQKLTSTLKCSPA